MFIPGFGVFCWSFRGPLPEFLHEDVPFWVFRGNEIWDINQGCGEWYRIDIVKVA